LFLGFRVPIQTAGSFGLGISMLLWLAFALMSAAVLAALLHPLLAGGATIDSASENSSGVYRDQLAEIEAEHTRGLIGADEAESARREIARRLLASVPDAQSAGTSALAVEDARPAASRNGFAIARPLAIALAVSLPIATIAIYLQTGRPGLPAQPIASRAVVPPVDPDMAKLIGAVEARLGTSPDDGRGWDVIAPVYLRLARYNDAVHAFSNAVRLIGESPRRLAGLAESRMLASGGRIDGETKAVLTRLLQLDPGNVQGLFWVAFSKEQDGKPAEALADYDQLLAGSPADAPWRQMIEERRQIIRAALPVPAEVPSPIRPAPGSLAPAPAIAQPESPGPSPSDVEAAARMSPADRQAMIEDMVSGLAARLEKDGRDLAGWQRLIRALSVLGRKDDAVAALDRARKSLAGEPASLTALADLARSLGLGT
jgi:cytochrome c-type biogenesis protein CcmH